MSENIKDLYEKIGDVSADTLKKLAESDEMKELMSNLAGQDVARRAFEAITKSPEPFVLPPAAQARARAFAEALKERNAIEREKLEVERRMVEEAQEFNESNARIEAQNAKLLAKLEQIEQAEATAEARRLGSDRKGH